VRHELTEAGAQQCDATPVQLIIEMLAPTVVLHLSSETFLKEANRRRRRPQCLKEPELPADVLDFFLAAHDRRLYITILKLNVHRVIKRFQIKR
jgi:hypothetical protein